MKHFYSLIATIFMSIAFAQTNNALHFDGVDDYVSTTKSAIQGNVARSFEAWIRTNENCIPGQPVGFNRSLQTWVLSSMVNDSLLTCYGPIPFD